MVVLSQDAREQIRQEVEEIVKDVLAQHLAQFRADLAATLDDCLVQLDRRAHDSTDSADGEPSSCQNVIAAESASGEVAATDPAPAEGAIEGPFVLKAMITYMNTLDERDRIADYYQSNKNRMSEDFQRTFHAAAMARLEELRGRNPSTAA